MRNYDEQMQVTSRMKPRREEEEDTKKKEGMDETPWKIKQKKKIRLKIEKLRKILIFTKYSMIFYISKRKITINSFKFTYKL